MKRSNLSLILFLFFILAALLFSSRQTKGQTAQEFVAATLILEAGGERDPRAMAAVREVVSNRAKARKQTEKEVVLARLQFSCWNAGTASAFAKAKRHAKWREALDLASSPSLTNYTLGADHYHTVQVSPAWSRKLLKTRQIGNHVFFRQK